MSLRLPSLIDKMNSLDKNKCKSPGTKYTKKQIQAPSLFSNCTVCPKAHVLNVIIYK